MMENVRYEAGGDEERRDLAKRYASLARRLRQRRTGSAPRHASTEASRTCCRPPERLLERKVKTLTGISVTPAPARGGCGRRQGRPTRSASPCT